MRNGSITPRDEGSAKQTQVLLLGRWSSEDVTKFEPLSGALVGALAQALLWKEGASKFIRQFSTVSFLESVARDPKSIFRFSYFPFIYRFKVSEFGVLLYIFEAPFSRSNA